ncbi:hypothetical protein AKJ09_06316 [Labilithrix luteola]|uniref:Uncharacterized protein n=1 Tax=Labilithrix luteola TaxID=1391654 RepID=A0A0K1Q1N3_9BACT|nr:hypothetical protein AKJ09_06316 [Labilithrix luteola]
MSRPVVADLESTFAPEYMSLRRARIRHGIRNLHSKLA